jgi:peptide-methionine (S)-S-oxide reductase
MSFMAMLSKKFSLPTSAEALPGRAEAIVPGEAHFVNGNSMMGPYPEGLETVLFGMGCFWGAERLFWDVARCSRDSRRLCRRDHTQPNLS